MNRTDIVVIGAGIGGLVAALELARRGHRVRVVESAPQVGGKARRVAVAGREVDAGPTVLTMAWVFESIFDAAGTRLADEASLSPLSVLARHAWPDGSRLDLHANLTDSADAIAAFAGAGEADGYRRFMAYAARLYDSVREPFLEAQRPTLGSLLALGPRRLLAATRIDATRTMASALATFFADPRLRQLFGRYATYCGGNPYLTPATFNLVAHVEQAGVWRVDGGIAALAEALARVAERHGAQVETEARVAEIRVDDGRARGVRLEDGRVIEAGTVVVNADAAALASGRLGETAAHAVAPVPRERRSFSAVTLTAVARPDGFPLSFHNVFFSADYQAELDALCSGRLPEEPTAYVCAQDRHGGGAPGGPERLLFILNAPANGDAEREATSEVDACLRHAMDLMARSGLTFPEMEATRTTPAQFERLFPGTGGALYGAAPHGTFSAMSRPAARSRLPGLYLCGGSVHPGAGVPMAALSGRRAAEAISEDLPSITSRRSAATSGGTSTSSPTTGAMP